MTAPHAPRIGIVVTDVYADEDPDHDTPLLLAALRAQGGSADAVVWHDAGIDLAGYDLLVIRSPWDYPDRPDEFHAWLDRAEATTRVVNPPPLMRWNLDKRYLAALEASGIRVVPTAYAETVDAAEAALDALRTPDDAAPGDAPTAHAVVKPTVSAGARDTGLFRADDPAALALAAKIIEEGGVAMVQPEVTELSAGHEKALYAVDGAFTHAIAKGALLEAGGSLRGGVYIENPVSADVTDAERAFAGRVLEAVTAITGHTPLYARIDLVDSAKYGLCLLEVELVEPALNLHVASEATDAVASAVLRAAL